MTRIFALAMLLLGLTGQAQAIPFGEEVAECAADRARIMGKPFDGNFGPCETLISERRAEAQRVARRTGVPVDTLVQTAPSTAALLADVERAKLAHDNAKNPSGIEQALAYVFAAAIVAAAIAIAKTKPWRWRPNIRALFARANTRGKRLVLIACPFFAITAIYRWMQDIDRHHWEPSLPFIIFAMASALCLLIAFTSLGDWIAASTDKSRCSDK